MLGNGQLEARARGALLNALHSAHPDAGTALREQMLRLAELFAANADSEENAEAAPTTTERTICEARARHEVATQLLEFEEGDADFAQFLRAAELFRAAGQAPWTGGRCSAVPAPCWPREMLRKASGGSR
jgi:hypothetical protein